LAFEEFDGGAEADDTEADFFAGTELAEDFEVGFDDAGQDGVAASGGVFAAENLGNAAVGDLDGAVPGAGALYGVCDDGEGEAFEADGHAGGVFGDAVGGAAEEAEGFRREEGVVDSGDDAERFEVVGEEGGRRLFAEAARGQRLVGGEGEVFIAVQTTTAELGLEVSG
jgi:hypothetical protein